MPKGVAEDESPEDEADKGPIIYQEAKVFNNEQYLISVYDNLKRKVVYFQVYGLDTQAEFWLKKDYASFDLLFRFNAELLNPNKKEGRFHWVIERLQIAKQGHEVKLVIGSEPGVEIAQLPRYDEKRKIPTGRMDLAERQRLREQMDKLDTQREENIRDKRARRQDAFLKHIYDLQAQDREHRDTRQSEISDEIGERLRMKDEAEARALREREASEKFERVRSRNVELKEQRTAERNQEKVIEMKNRWRAADQRKAQLIREARMRHEQAEKKKADDAKERQRALQADQSKREKYWKQRDSRMQARDEHWLKTQMDLIKEVKRKQALKTEKMKDYLKELQRERGPIFEAQIERTRERQAAKEAEEEALAVFKASQAKPPWINKKAVKAQEKHAAASIVKPKAAESEPEKTDDEPVSTKAPGKKKKRRDSKAGDEPDSPVAVEKSDTAKKIDAVLDNVEATMRAKMDKDKHVAHMNALRESRIAVMEARRKQAEHEHNKAYQKKWQQDQDAKELIEKERREIQREHRYEEEKADEKRKQQAKRNDKIRAESVARIEARALAARSG